MDDQSEETLGELANRIAEIENTENGQDDRMYLAINQFISTREQSYDQFLNGFTQLTMEDVLKYKENTMNKNKGEEKLTTKLLNQSCKGYNAEQTTLVQELEDDLEVELLEEVNKPTTVTDSGKPTGRSLVKFDNFVDDEPTDDTAFPEDPELNDLLQDSSYTASFNETTTRGTTLGVCAVDQPHKSSTPCVEVENNTETNFGEVDDSIEISVKHSAENPTCLELRSTDVFPPADNIVTQESITDEVEEFHLDPNFDYDNVRLTPKFSEDDLRIIMASADTLTT